MITLAFYKGRAADPLARLQDAAIRFATRGRYSHVELLQGSAGFGAPVECLSASARDRGVRAKVIALRPAHWDLVELAIAPARPAGFIRARIGAPYDYTGILLSHVLAMSRHDKDAWFCSEIIGAALGLPAPHRLSPQMLFDVVTWERADRFANRP